MIAARGRIAPAVATAAMTQPTSKLLGELSAEALAARAQGGDEACFQELVVRMRGPLTAFIARRLTRAADADDAVQETFLRAYQYLDRYDPGRRFSTWLFAIGKNVAANHRVAERRRDDLARRSEEASVAAAAVPGVDEPEADAVWQTARRVLGAEAYRALWLRYAQDLSVAEIARELDRSVVATKVMLLRARRKLLQEEP